MNSNNYQWVAHQAAVQQLLRLTSSERKVVLDRIQFFADAPHRIESEKGFVLPPKKISVQSAEISAPSGFAGKNTVRYRGNRLFTLILRLLWMKGADMGKELIFTIAALEKGSLGRKENAR